LGRVAVLRELHAASAGIEGEGSVFSRPVLQYREASRKARKRHIRKNIRRKGPEKKRRKRGTNSRGGTLKDWGKTQNRSNWGLYVRNLKRVSAIPCDLAISINVDEKQIERGKRKELRACRSA